MKRLRNKNGTQNLTSGADPEIIFLQKWVCGNAKGPFSTHTTCDILPRSHESICIGKKKMQTYSKMREEIYKEPEFSAELV